MIGLRKIANRISSIGFIIFVALIFQSSINAGHRRQVYDCFMFFNEVEVLKIRLHELSEIVDYFVLVESKVTFSGKPKPSYYLENISEFKEYKHKIIHILLNELVTTENKSECFWKNEKYQRNMYLKGVENAEPSDIMICSDVDEIPRAEMIKKVILDNKYFSANHVYFPEMDYFLFRLNNIARHKWKGATISTVKVAKEVTPQKLREGHYSRKRTTIIPNGGWHFSWIGDSEMALYKLKSFSHAKDHFVKDDKIMLKYFNNHLDLDFTGSSIAKPYLIPIDERYPKYVIQNQNLLKSKGLIEELN